MQLYRSVQRRDTKYWEEENVQDFHQPTGPDYTERLDNISDLEVLDWEVDELTQMVLSEMGPSHQSNLFKWSEMANDGGVYLDMDIVFVRPIEDWWIHVRDFDVAISYHKPGRYFSIGLLGSRGNNAFFRDVFDESVLNFDPKVYQSVGVESLYRLLGGKFIDHWQVLLTRYVECQFRAFSMDYVYPWKCDKMVEVFERLHMAIPESTFGIHWYAGDAVSQKGNARLDERVVKSEASTIAYWLRTRVI
jgi:hypothetical protein